MCLTIAVAVVAGCTPVTAQQTGGSTVGARAGVATGWQTLWASDAEQNADYAGVAASGASWTTLDIDWNHIQDRGPTSYNWNVATDRAVHRRVVAPAADHRHRGVQPDVGATVRLPGG